MKLDKDLGREILLAIGANDAPLTPGLSSPLITTATLRSPITSAAARGRAHCGARPVFDE